MTRTPEQRSPIYHARHLKRLSQKEVARRARIAQRYFCTLENGDSQPTIPVARRIAAVLGCSVDVLWPPDREREATHGADSPTQAA